MGAGQCGSLAQSVRQDCSVGCRGRPSGRTPARALGALPTVSFPWLVFEGCFLFSTLTVGPLLLRPSDPCDVLRHRSVAVFPLLLESLCWGESAPQLVLPS